MDMDWVKVWHDDGGLSDGWLLNQVSLRVLAK